MNGACETPQEQLCGCCTGTGTETPEPITNRPGLSAIRYRVGTQPAFKSSLLANLSDADLPALAVLTTRGDSDFSIALLDAWAVALDILTFYQERIANESYLGTAVDRRSVFELARLVGYRPSPGVAASTFIAFTLNDAPGSPENVPIPASTRVQSVPAPGESPQTFETSSDITALIENNTLPPQTTVPWGVSNGDTSIWLQGTANKLNPGDGLLFVGSPLHNSVLAGNASATGACDFHLITSVTVDSNAGNTYVTWDGGLNWPDQNDNAVYVYVFRKKASLLGAQAPDPRTISHDAKVNVPGFNTDATDWNFRLLHPGEIQLDSSYPGLAPVTAGEPQWIVLKSHHTTAAYHITLADETAPGYYTITSKVSRLQIADEQVIVNTGPTPVLNDLVEDTRNTSAYIQSELLTPADQPYMAWSLDGSYIRQSGLLKPVEGTALEIVGGQHLAAGQPVAVSGKRLRIQVKVGASASFVPDKGTGGLTVSDGQIFLVDAFPPSVESRFRRLGSTTFAPLRTTSLKSGTAVSSKLVTSALAPLSVTSLFRIFVNQVWSVETLDGVSGTLHISPGDAVLLPADKKDTVVSEGAMISQLSVNGAITTMSFDQALARIYDRSTISVNANTVEATHGETVHEILGSGDATNPGLQFTLKQTPLTFVSSSVASGTASTLQIWVNNLQWHEVSNFIASSANDRVFITRMDAAGKVTVQFGDGDPGARPPTGQMNIRAVYRKGIGVAGMVQAGQLTQPLDRPQGLKSSNNPDAATGGADPDSADAARTSAPLHVLTLDRVVSLEDYENFARAFAGVSKALATWTWFGHTRGIFLTVAGANGTVLNRDDETIVNLTKALRSSGNPFIPLQVASFLPVSIEIGAKVKVDTENHDSSLVLAAVWQALSDQFSLEQRDIGQGIAQSEVLATVQGVAGVTAVALTTFNRQGAQPVSRLPVVLRASAPLVGGEGVPQAGEMLLLDPSSQGNLGVWG